jgi:hypothetical protein
LVDVPVPGDATFAVPTIVPAPGLFSTATGSDHFVDIASATNRATTSAGPPAAKGTIKRTFLVGKPDCARARGSRVTPTVAAKPATTCLRRIMHFLACV